MKTWEGWMQAVIKDNPLEVIVGHGVRCNNEKLLRNNE